MKVVITGKGGQLASELIETAPAFVEVVAYSVSDLDITNRVGIEEVMAAEAPNIVINAAAYTAVDRAESDSATAYLVNEVGARNLAEVCKTSGVRLLHVSTDFVFDGTKTKPYLTDDSPNPLNVYGASKLAGDNAVVSVLPEASLIVRTAWVYSATGNNFVKSMLRLMAEKPELGIVYDQVGTPTWAKGLAQWLWAVVEKPEVTGVYHWTDAGVASWYDFAVAIQELALEKGLLSAGIPIRPIKASQYPTPATRPAFSVIDKASAEQVSGIQTVHWRKQLSAMMDELC